MTTDTANDPALRRLLDQIEAARVLGLKNPRTLAAWRLRRQGPPFHRIGKRMVRYDAAELRAWAGLSAAAAVA